MVDLFSVLCIGFAHGLEEQLNVCNGQPRCEEEPLSKTLIPFNRILYRLSWPQCGQDLQPIDMLQVYTHALIRQRLGLSIRRVDAFSAHVKVPRLSTEPQSRPLKHIRSLLALAKPQDIAPCTKEFTVSQHKLEQHKF